jgi:fructan beta-fructosidase
VLDGLFVENQVLQLEAPGSSFEFEATVEWDKVEEFGIRLRVSEGEATVAGFSAASNEVFLDRTAAGFSDMLNRSGKPAEFARRFHASRFRSSNRMKMHGFVDASSVELFFDDGLQVFTSLIYPKPESGGLDIYARGGSVKFQTLRIHVLKSIWEEDQ